MTPTIFIINSESTLTACLQEHMLVVCLLFPALPAASMTLLAPVSPGPVLGTGRDLDRKERKLCRPLHPKWPKVLDSWDGCVGRAVGLEEDSWRCLGSAFKQTGAES